MSLLLIKHAKLIVICWFEAMALHHAGLLMQFSQQVWFSLLELKTYFKITELRIWAYSLIYFHLPPISLLAGTSFFSFISYLGEWGFPWCCSQMAPVVLRWKVSCEMLLKCLYPPSSKLLLPLLLCQIWDKFPWEFGVNSEIVFWCSALSFCFIFAGRDWAHQMHFDFLIFLLLFDPVWETCSGLLLTG